MNAAFAFRVAGKILRRQDRACPFCERRETTLVARKGWLLELRRCDVCALLFRWPKDGPAESRDFHQRRYRDRGITEIPDDAILEGLLERAFRGTAQDYASRIRLLLELLPAGGRWLDYGASWGYTVFQLRRAGLDAMGLEISKPRAEAGARKLGVPIESDAAALATGSFDVIHSAHVLEHIPDLRHVFDELRRLIAPGGTLALFVPNAGGRSARERGVDWEPLIGERHVLALTPEFFDRNLPAWGFTPEFAASPYSERPAPLSRAAPLDGGELLVLARRNPA